MAKARRKRSTTPPPAEPPPPRVAGSWSPSKAEWARIHRRLPPPLSRDDIRQFNQQVILAAWLYFGSHPYFETWVRIAKAAQSKAIEKLCREIDCLNSSSRDTAESWAKEWASSLQMLIALANRVVQSGQILREERRELLYQNLLAACTGPGKLPLNVSVEGPLNRVMKTILTLVLPDPPSSRGIKDIIKREKDRQAKGVSVGGLRRLQ